MIRRKSTIGSLLASIYLTGVVVGGCSIFNASEREYQSSTSLPPLEVPPDLTKPDWNSRMAIPGDSAGRVSALETSRHKSPGGDIESAPQAEPTVLPEFNNITVRKEGTVRWLEVRASTASLWPKLRNFWQQEGIALEKADPRVGVMETEWYEYRKALPKSFLLGLFGRVYNALSDSGVRDKYRLRLERASAQVTNIYLTQRRAEQVGDISADEVSVRWESRPSDPELEAEMLARLMIYLGTTKERAVQQIAATQASASTPMTLRMVEGNPVLYVEDEFARVWRRTGIALDRAGLFVEQQNRTKGIYYFTYTRGAKERQKGFFARLFSKSSELEVNEVYQVHLQSHGNKTLITAYDNGEDDVPTALHPDAAEKILKRLKSAYQASGSNV
jgi:outer membrane protein assembly factor BamC